MQTKNVNLNQAAQNTNNSITEKSQLESGRIMSPNSGNTVVVTIGCVDSNSDTALASPDAPPLPPRGHATQLAPTQHLYRARLVQAEVDGYGPYKPVPPPKPLPGAPSGGGGCYSPPPYRMPPYPLYGETAIPGAAVGSDSTISTAALHTHSSKFPIEREVILSSTDKNSKIPILNEYKKWSKTSTTAIAPDGPAKQVAWTEEKKVREAVNKDENQLILTRIQHNYRTEQGAQDNIGMEDMGHHIYQTHASQMHDNNRQQKMQHPQGSTSEYRPAYSHNGHQSGVSTGAVPRTWGNKNEDSNTRHTQHYQSSHIVARPPAALPHHEDAQQNSTSQAASSESMKRDASSERKVEGREDDDEDRNNAQNSGNCEVVGKDGQAKDLDKSKTFSSRTLHSIKDIISSRFGGTKGLNKDGSGESVSESERNKESGQNGSLALNNNSSFNDVANKSVTASPRKLIQRDDTGNIQIGTHEVDVTQRSHTLSGNQQVLGPSRNYGESHGMSRTYQIQGRRTGTEIQGLPSNRATEMEDTTRRSGRGKGGPLDHGVYATARISHQEHHSRSIGDFTRELPPQPVEPVYGYHGQRLGQANKVTPRMPQHFGSQPGLLDQSGIYMVMRQNTGNPQQHYISQSTDGRNQQTQIHIENGQRPEYETTQHATIHQINEARKLALEAKTSSQQERDTFQNGESNTATLPRDTQKRDIHVPSRRGSQCRLDEDDDEGGFLSSNRGISKSGHDNHSSGAENFITQGAPSSCTSGSYSQQQSSGQSSDYEKATQRSSGQSSSNADSGRGSTIYSSGRQLMAGTREDASERLDTSTESSESPQTPGRREGIYGIPSTVGNDSEWVDIVESELRQILDPKLHGLSLVGASNQAANSTLSESISSLTPPLPPLSPDGGSSPAMSPRNSTRYKLPPSLPYGSKLDYSEAIKHGDNTRKTPQGGAISKSHHSRSGTTGNTPSSRGWSSRTGKGQTSDKQHRQIGSGKKMDQLLGSSSKGGKGVLSASAFGLDSTDLTSTTTGLDSMLDGNTENNSSDDDLSTTIDATDAHAIRKQLEGLENMYSEVLKLLGVKKYGGRYQPSDPRISKRRLYGSMSSLPSSVSSRPIRDKRRQDERKKVKDIKGINKRFQRLESHVVTLARSVAHLSSEMRTQHLMIQEMENIRGEIAALRTQTLAVRSQSIPRGINSGAPADRDSALPALTNPARVKKLTKFFGDEPPLLRLFLKKLGYEKYAGSFEHERIGMVELPYLTEERLQKMGIPLGPRLRILQEAQISVCRDKVYIV